MAIMIRILPRVVADLYSEYTHRLQLDESDQRTPRFTMKEIGPPIWRRIQTKDCTLDKLHEHIQTAKAAIGDGKGLDTDAGENRQSEQHTRLRPSSTYLSDGADDLTGLRGSG
jgi:hypothetical protein